MNRIICFCVVTWLSVICVQAQRRTTLYSLLNELSQRHKTSISFSPTLTNEVYPSNTDTSGDLATALKRILIDTDFDYKIIGGKHYLIYWNPMPPAPNKVVKPTPPFVEVKPDTTGTAVVKVTAALPVSVTPQFKMPALRMPNIARPTTHAAAALLGASKVAIKTNLLYDATTTLNLGIEIASGKRTTFDLSANYNPWEFADNRKMKHWLIQPEFRYWMCQRFSGGFWGIHAHYGEYNWGGMLPWGFKTGKMFGTIQSDNLLNHRYEGWVVGAGVSYGYHWIVGKRWGVEAQIGAGYAYLKYDKYRCERCGEVIGREYQNYFGPTKVSISLIYMLK